MREFNINVFHHNCGETEKLTEISKKLDLLISMEGDTAKLAAAAKKLGLKTDALESVLEKQDQPTKE